MKFDYMTFDFLSMKKDATLCGRQKFVHAFLRIAGVVLGLSVMSIPASAQAPVRPTQKPNIVFIMSDDHAYQAISAYSEKLIKTPAIDRIAKEGVIFKKGYVTNSICSPSRAVILTGKYSHVNGLRDNTSEFDGSQQTLPKILQQHGYRTAVVGKWHLFSDPTGFNYWNVLPDQGEYYNPDFIEMGKDTVYSGYVTDIITNIALDWVKSNKDETFCLFLYHKAPHRNWMPDLKYLDSLNGPFPLPANFSDDYRDREALQRQQLTIANHMDIRWDSKIPCESCPTANINAWAPHAYRDAMNRL